MSWLHSFYWKIRCCELVPPPSRAPRLSLERHEAVYLFVKKYEKLQKYSCWDGGNRNGAGAKNKHAKGHVELLLC